MVVHIESARGIARWLACLALLTTSMLAPDWAEAASMADCPAEYRNLESSFPNGVTEIWAETLQDDLNAVNALDDKASLRQAQEKTWAEFDAYQENPDPDGDGYAFAPEVVQGHMYLMTCLYVARGLEVEGGDEEAEPQVQPDAESAADVAESLESPPTPIGSSSAWFTEADYPVVAMREEREGVVSYDLTVGSDGSVVGCEASGPPGGADLERATCDAIIARARFKPATNEAGQPVVGEVSGSIRWILPD